MTSTWWNPRISLLAGPLVICPLLSTPPLVTPAVNPLTGKSLITLPQMEKRLITLMAALMAVASMTTPTAAAFLMITLAMRAIPLKVTESLLLKTPSPTHAILNGLMPLLRDFVVIRNRSYEGLTRRLRGERNARECFLDKLKMLLKTEMA